jgi:hypothetical protein
MTLAERPRAATRSVVREIADRRLADVKPELDALGAAALARAVAAAPEPRPIVDALAAPGLHLIAEVKRRSPSAGAIVEADDALARAEELRDKLARQAAAGWDEARARTAVRGWLFTAVGLFWSIRAAASLRRPTLAA